MKLFSLLILWSVSLAPVGESARSLPVGALVVKAHHIRLAELMPLPNNSGAYDWRMGSASAWLGEEEDSSDGDSFHAGLDIPLARVAGELMFVAAYERQWERTQASAPHSAPLRC